MDLNITAAILFISLLCIFLYTRRDKIVMQGPFPVFYIILYKTKAGLALMDRLSKWRIWHSLSGPMIALGFAGMVYISFEVLFTLFLTLTSGKAVAGVGIIQPFAPDVPGTIYVKFIYFIIAISFIAITHEFFHGVIARSYNIHLKSTGFAFAGILLPFIPAAFVEPDENDLKKRPPVQQLAVYAAGPFINIISAFFFLLVIWLAINPIASALYEPDGIVIHDFSKDKNQSWPAEVSGMKKGEMITSINSVQIQSGENLTKLLSALSPNQSVSIVTNLSNYTLILASHPSNSSKPFIGIIQEPHMRLKPEAEQSYGTRIPDLFLWFSELLVWLFLLSLGIGLFNLVPLGPIDGGRMSYVFFTQICGVKYGQYIWVVISLVILVAILGVLGMSMFG